MNTTKMSEESTKTQPVKVVDGVKAHTTGGQEAGMIETHPTAQTLSQRVAICFTAGVLGALAVLLFGPLLSWFGLGAKGPIHFPASFKAPGIYRPLFWGGLWGIPFGLFIKAAWKRRYLFGLLYFLAPMAALFLFSLPMGGAGYFGLKAGEPIFPLYVMLVNLPFGVTTALVARAIIGKTPQSSSDQSHMNNEQNPRFASWNEDGHRRF